jgi:hypothetical protein
MPVLRGLVRRNASAIQALGLQPFADTFAGVAKMIAAAGR